MLPILLDAGTAKKRRPGSNGKIWSWLFGTFSGFVIVATFAAGGGLVELT